MPIHPAKAYEGEVCVTCYGCGCDWSPEIIRAAYDATITAFAEAGIAPNRLSSHGKWGSFQHKRHHLERSGFEDIRFLSLSHRIDGEEYSERALALASLQPLWGSFELSWLPSLIGEPAERFHQLFKELAIMSRMGYGYRHSRRIVVPPKFYTPPKESLESEFLQSATYWTQFKSEQADSLLLRNIYPNNFLSQPYLDAPVGCTGLSLREWIEDDPGDRGDLKPFTDILTEWTPPPDNIPHIREALFRAGRLFYYRFFQKSGPYFRPNIREPWQATDPIPEIFKAARYRDLLQDRQPIRGQSRGVSGQRKQLTKTNEHRNHRSPERTPPQLAVAKFNLRKRNKVIRKYCPQFFEKEPPANHGKLLATGDIPIDALILLFDEAGDLTDAWAVKKPLLLKNVFSDDDEFKQTMRTIRARHLETDTIVFDVTAISREAGRDMIKDIFRAACDRAYRFRGMTQPQIAHALLDSSILRPAQSASSHIDSLSLEEFFEGNEVDSSIAPNAVGYGHPGIAAFRETLLQTRSQPGVVDVRIGVHEWPYPDETDMWIAAENVYIWCKDISIEDVKQWLAPLKPIAVAPVEPTSIPKHGPETDEHTQVFTAIWD